jgi:uncharacterized membrane protein YdfJ with MMPL/SSD domain
MEERPKDQFKADKALYRNGWLVGFLVAYAISIAVLVIFRESQQPFMLLLIVGLPVGGTIGVFAGLAAEGQAIRREMKYTIGLATLTGLLLFYILLGVYLLFHI